MSKETKDPSVLQKLLPKPAPSESREPSNEEPAVPLKDLGNNKDEKAKDDKPKKEAVEPKSPEPGEDENVPLISPRLSIDERNSSSSSDDSDDGDGKGSLDPIMEDGNGGKPTKPPPSVDKNSDAETIEQKRLYRRHIQSFISDNKKIKEILHENVRKNFVSKLRILCKVMKKKGISLADEDMLGEKSKEPVLCLAIILGHTECSEILCEYGKRKLVELQYDTKAHKGTTALHLAILKQNLQSITYMMSCLDPATKQKFLHIRASGSHFEDRYNCACLPLSLAAGVGNMSIFNTLVKNGADPWIGDEDTGNTVLHSLAAIAIHDPAVAVTTMMKILDSEEVKAWWAQKKSQEDVKERLSKFTMKTALLKAENKDGHTPFMYASSLGAVQFANAILDIEKIYKFPQWEVGPSSYVIHEMSEIDTAIPDSSFPDPPNPIERNSTERAKALEIFAFVLRDDKLNFGKIPAIKLAMINKWSTYRGWFIGWMVVHFLVMVSFTLSAQFYVRMARDPQNLTEPADNMTRTITAHSELATSRKNQFILFLDCLVLVVAIVYFVLEVFDIVVLLKRQFWRAQGFKRAKRMSVPVELTLQFDIFRTLLFTFSLFVILIFCLKLAGSPWQDFAYAIAAMTGWSFMLFFTRAFENIGIFTVMLQRMITRELLYFAVVFLVIMAGFSTATYCLFQESLEKPPGEVSTMAKTFFSFFRLLLGLEELAVSEEARLPWVMKVIFILFVLLANILLLNMLIAAMNNTYTQLENLKETLWLKMRIKAVLLLERRLITRLRPRSNLRKYGRTHQWFLASEEVKAWHPLAGGTDVVL